MEVQKSRSTQWDSTLKHLESWNNIDMTSWQSFHLIQSIVGWIWYSPRRDKLQEELNELQRGSLGDTGSVDKRVKCGRICAYSTTRRRILHRCLAAWFLCMDWESRYSDSGSQTKYSGGFQSFARSLVSPAFELQICRARCALSLVLRVHEHVRRFIMVCQCSLNQKPLQ